MDETPVALITGTSRGLGLGIAKYFLEEGYRVIGCSRSPSTLDSVSYEHTLLDVGENSKVRQWIAGVARSYGRIDVVVNNAGLMPPTAIAMSTLSEQAEAAIKTNYLGPYAICREASKVMQKRRFGRIINLSTIATELHSEGASAYLASKSAMVEFTKVLAKELAPIGITANVLAVSMAETDMSSKLSNQARERYLNNFAIKRCATIEDVCNVVSFFANANSGYVTGQVVNLGFVD